MRIDVADKIRYTIDRITDKAIRLNSDLAKTAATDTLELASLKRLCMEYLEYPLIQALRDDI